MRLVSMVSWLSAASACGARSPTPARPPIANQPTATKPGIALAVVFSGWELFAGNDTQVEADDPSRYPGVFPAIDAELPKLATLPGAGSMAALIVYADRASLTHPFEPLRGIAAGWLGTQQTYFKKFGIELVSGVELAAATLDKAPPELERVMLVIGDGCDTNLDEAPGRFAKLGLGERRIAVHQIQIETQLSAKCPPLANAKVHGTSLTAGIDHFVAAFR